MENLCKTIFILALIHLSSHIYAQKIYPDKSVKINKKILAQCQKIVADIDSMPLKCNTMFWGLKNTCFDKQGRLRKYLYNPSSRGPGGDGSGEYVSVTAWYDENGNLVYIKHESGSNCHADDEYYYVHNGLIVDFTCEKSCWCCEEGEEELNEEEINHIRPVIGSALITTTSSWPLTNFIRTKTLLSILNSQENSGSGEIYGCCYNPLQLMEPYVCYDNDGYTNIRKGPGIQYKIVDKVSKYETFFSWNRLYIDGTYLDPLTWLPFVKDIKNDFNQFIFRKNIRSLHDMPQLMSDIIENNILSCSNDTIRINLVLKDFDRSKHVVKDSLYDRERKFIQTIDGEFPKGLPLMVGKNGEIKGKEIDALYIEKRNKKIVLSVNAIKSYFNPREMVVFLGRENELYIYITVDNNKESSGIYLSVVDGVVKYILKQKDRW